MTWHEVVRTFANESEIGRGNKLLDPEVRPSNPLLGDSAIQAYRTSRTICATGAT